MTRSAERRARGALVYVETRKVDVREFKLPWREAGSPNHHDDIVDSDQ